MLYKLYWSRSRRSQLLRQTVVFQWWASAYDNFCSFELQNYLLSYQHLPSRHISTKVNAFGYSTYKV